MSMNYADVLLTLESVIDGFKKEAARIRTVAATHALKHVTAGDQEARVQALCLEHQALGLDSVVLHMVSYLAGLKSQRPDPKMEENAKRWSYLLRFISAERLPAAHYKADQEFRYTIPTAVTTVDVMKGSVAEHFTDWVDLRRKAES